MAWNMPSARVAAGGRKMLTPLTPMTPPDAAQARAWSSVMLRAWGPERLGVRVREYHRSLGKLECVHRGAIAGVRAVNDHADPVHLADEADPELTEAAIGALMASIADMVLLVVGEQRVPHAEPVEKVDKLDASLERGRVLEMETDG